MHMNGIVRMFVSCAYNTKYQALKTFFIFTAYYKPLLILAVFFGVGRHYPHIIEMKTELLLSDIAMDCQSHSDPISHSGVPISQSCGYATPILI